MTWRRDQLDGPHEFVPWIEEPFPLPVVPDWNAQVRKADRLARLIDRHLNREERERRMPPGEKLTPIGLGPEQRVRMLTDGWAATRS